MLIFICLYFHQYMYYYMFIFLSKQRNSNSTVNFLKSFSNKKKLSSVIYIYIAYICIYVSLMLTSSKQVPVYPYKLIFLSIKVFSFDNMFVCALCHITYASNGRDITSIGLIFQPIAYVHWTHAKVTKSI